MKRNHIEYENLLVKKWYFLRKKIKIPPNWHDFQTQVQIKDQWNGKFSSVFRLFIWELLNSKHWNVSNGKIHWDKSSKLYRVHLFGYEYFYHNFGKLRKYGYRGQPQPKTPNIWPSRTFTVVEAIILVHFCSKKTSL